MKKPVKIKKICKKTTSRKNKCSSEPINSRTNQQVYLKDHSFRSVFHTLALAQCNTEL